MKRIFSVLLSLLFSFSLFSQKTADFEKVSGGVNLTVNGSLVQYTAPIVTYSHTNTSFAVRINDQVYVFTTADAITVNTVLMTSQTPAQICDLLQSSVFVATAGSFYDSTLMASTKRLKDTAAALRTSMNSKVMLSDATDASFTMTVNASIYLPAATLSQNRTITIPAGSSGYSIEIFNNEAGFAWLLGGSSVYLSDGITAITQLTANTNYYIRNISGKWRILN